MVQEQEETKVKNNVTIKDVGPCKKNVIIEIPEESVTAVVDEQYRTLRKDAIVPGFRKGRAPRRLLEKRYGKETKEQIKLKLIADASESAIKDNELEVLGDPDIDHKKIELPEKGSLKFEFAVEVKPEFELPELEGIAVTKTKMEVTAEQVDSEIEYMRKYSGVWTPRQSGGVEAGDEVIADVILKVEGVEEEEKLDNIEIFVRPGGAVGAVPVEKLDKLLIGANAGDTKETGITVEKTYFREEYRGKKVDIKITVKDIKWLKPAELNEDFFSRVGAADEKDMRRRIEDVLAGRIEQQSRSEMSEQIYRYMLDNTKFELPVDIVAAQANSILQRQYSGLMRRGLDNERLAEEMEKLRAGSEEQAKEQLKIFFIMDKVSDKLEIEVGEEEINGHIARLAIQRGQRPEQLREEMARNGSLAQFGLQVREEKCIAKLLESAKVTESKDGKKAKKAAKKTAPKVKASKKKTVSKSKKADKKETDK